MTLQNCLLTGRSLSQSAETDGERPRRLTYYLKQVGKQDDVLGRPRPVRPVAEQRPGQEAAEAERRQDQTQKVWRRIQSLQVPPHRWQDHGWRSRSGGGGGESSVGYRAAACSIYKQPKVYATKNGSILPNWLLTAWAAPTPLCNEPRADIINHHQGAAGLFFFSHANTGTHFVRLCGVREDAVVIVSQLSHAALNRAAEVECYWT